MNLREYLQNKDKSFREDFAKAAGTTLGQLIQMMDGHRVPSRFLAARLEKASGGVCQYCELIVKPTEEELESFGRRSTVGERITKPKRAPTSSRKASRKDGSKAKNPRGRVTASS